MKNYSEIDMAQTTKADTNEYETNERTTFDMSKKYRLSLIHLLKEFLLLLLRCGIIGAVVLNIIMFVGFKSPFDIIECIAYIICGAFLGIVIGYCIKVFWKPSFADFSGATIYNMYAGIHNLHVLSNSTVGSGLTIFGIFFTIVKFLFVMFYSLLLIPVSIVYLCIMTIIETVTHGIPEGLGNFLDKLVYVGSGIGSIAIILFLMSKIR